VGLFNKIFSGDDAEENNNRIENLLSVLKKNSDSAKKCNRIKFVELLELYLKKDSDNKILYMDEDSLCDSINMMISREVEAKHLNYISNLYILIVDDKESIEQKELFKKFADIYVRLVAKGYYAEYTEGDIMKFETFSEVYNMFEDKKLVFSIYNIFDEKYLKFESKNIVNYIKKGRKYYISEKAFFSRISDFIREMIESSPVDYATLLQNFLATDEKLAGFYEIDEEKLDELYEEFCNLKVELDQLKNDKNDLANLFNEIKREKKVFKKWLQAEVAKSIDDLKKKYEDFEDNFKLLCSESSSEIRDLTKESLKTLRIKLIDENNKIQVKIEQLEKLNAELGEKLDLVPNEALSSEVRSLNSSVSSMMLESNSYNKDITIVKNTESSSILSRKDLAASEVFSSLLLKKKSNSSQLFNESFDKILKEVILNNPVMIVGPAGSGKTNTVYQLADLVGLRCFNLGFVVDEHESIKGFNDILGRLVKTPFYECFRDGGICLFDEIDSSESKALTELNKIISSNNFSPYLFGNGELIYPHPDFRIVATSNTWGDGADSLYSTREKLDASTIDRFSRVWYDYDKNLEKKILGEYIDWYEFTIAFREFLTDRHIDKVISTRTFSGIKEHLDSKMFTADEILSIYFINGMRSDTLKGACSVLKNNISMDNKVIKVFENNISDNSNVVRVFEKSISGQKAMKR